MSCPFFVKDSPSSFVVYLELASGGPALGRTDADVAASLKKEGGVFNAFALDNTNFVELSGGMYQVSLEGTDTDVEGNLYLSITGSGLKPSLHSGFVFESIPTAPVPVPSLPKTALWGYVISPSGTAIAGASVSARVLASPSISASGPSVLGTALVSAKTDASGFFSIELVTGSTVDLFIPASNYRRTLLVPSSTSNLFDIP